jgi:hypothetical protein
MLSDCWHGSREARKPIFARGPVRTGRDARSGTGDVHDTFGHDCNGSGARRLHARLGHRDLQDCVLAQVLRAFSQHDRYGPEDLGYRVARYGGDAFKPSCSGQGENPIGAMSSAMVLAARPRGLERCPWRAKPLGVVMGGLKAAGTVSAFYYCARTSLYQSSSESSYRVPHRLPGAARSRDDNRPAIDGFSEAAVDKLTTDAKAANVRLHLLVSPQDGRLDDERICTLLPDWQKASAWFCGPTVFGRFLRKDLIVHGLAPSRFVRNCSGCADSGGNMISITAYFWPFRMPEAEQPELHASARCRQSDA